MENQKGITPLGIILAIAIVLIIVGVIVAMVVL